MRFIFSLLIALVIFCVGALVGSFVYFKYGSTDTQTGKQIQKIIPKPLVKYEIESLKLAQIPEGEFELVETLFENDDYTSYLFKFTFSPTLENSSASWRKTTGQLNIPISEKDPNKKYPVIIMARGYVDQSIYQTGIGTRNGAAFFAENGFITVAPDFLGYAGSDSESADIFETRFQTYTTFISLLENIDQIDEWDGKNVFIWAHSNGGQVALTSLVARGYDYPTTLWAPVTKMFPYSVLYYTDESEDRGKFIRSELSEFEKIYDADKFSFDLYLDNIKAPIQLHQGTADDAIPVDWSNSFINSLEAMNEKKEEEDQLEINYYVYSGADHNMRPVWDEVIKKDLDFFRKFIQ